MLLRVFLSGFVSFILANIWYPVDPNICSSQYYAYEVEHNLMYVLLFYSIIFTVSTFLYEHFEGKKKTVKKEK